MNLDVSIPLGHFDGKSNIPALLAKRQTLSERRQHKREQDRVRAKATNAPTLRTYLETAQDLAEAHRRADPGTEAIFLVPDPAEQEVRLVEVSTRVPTSGDVFAFGYSARPDLGIAFRSAVVLLSPDEWRNVESGLLLLPPGWDLRARRAL
jgi:hypothetical protein